MSLVPAEAPPRPRRVTLNIVISIFAAFAAVCIAVAISPASAADTWHDNSRSHRVIVTVNPAGVDRADTDVTFDINFTTAFAQAGTAGAVFKEDSIKVVEVNASGDRIDGLGNSGVPFQFVRGSGYSTATKASGELSILLSGATTSTRTFQVYFRSTATAGTYAVADHSGLGRVSLLQNTTDAGRNVHRISAGGVVWYYDTAGGGFSSIEAGGQDWVKWSTAAGSAGMFRGIPNMQFTQGVENGPFHPGHNAVDTSVVANGPLRVVLQSTVTNGQGTTRWSISPDRAVMEVLEVPADGNYWVLYEGTPGGALDANDVIIRNDGVTVNALTGAFAADLANPEWMAAADPNRGWSLWMAQLDGGTEVDSYKALDGSMTIMAFGRLASGVAQGITTPRTFAFGLENTTTHGGLVPLVEGATSPFTVTVAGGQSGGSTTTTTTSTSTTTPTTSTSTTSIPGAPSGDGYWILTSAGRMLRFGGVSSFGQTTTVNAVAAAATTTGEGYWIVNAQGAVQHFGDAVHYGDASSLALKAPIVGMAATRTGLGYWLLGSDGGVFSYGDAEFHGSTGGLALVQPVTDMVPSASGEGYYLVAKDGGVFAFGDAKFHGSTGAIKLDEHMTSLTASAAGYWLVALDGGIFAYGDAKFLGSLPQIFPTDPPEGRRIRSVDGGKGYFILSADGALFGFGSASNQVQGSAAGALASGEVAVDLVVFDQN